MTEKAGNEKLVCLPLLIDHGELKVLLREADNPAHSVCSMGGVRQSTNSNLKGRWRGVKFRGFRLVVRAVGNQLLNGICPRINNSTCGSKEWSQ